MSMFLIFQTSPGDLHAPLHKIPVCAKLPRSPDLYLNKTYHEKEKMFNCVTDILMQDTFLVVVYALIFFKRGIKNYGFHLQWEQQKVRRINVRGKE